MTTSFVAYIDEPGCEGFTFMPDEAGSSRWFVLSAVVVRKENDNLVVQLAREARTLLRKDPKKALHFRELKHEHRVPLARLIGKASLRTVSVLIHKPSIAEPEVFQNQRYSLYRYATRLLAERISWLCRDGRRTSMGDGKVELIFSNRSAMSYDELREYLESLNGNPAADARIDWNVIDPKLIRAVNHDQLAGLQLADAVTSGIFFAINKTQYGETEDRYLRLLSPTIYRHQQRVEGYGLKIWCEDAAETQRILQAGDVPK